MGRLPALSLPLHAAELLDTLNEIRGNTSYVSNSSAREDPIEPMVRYLSRLNKNQGPGFVFGCGSNNRGNVSGIVSTSMWLLVRTVLDLVCLRLTDTLV